MVQIIKSNGGGGSGGGGTSYSAGNGIDITSNEISIDEAVVQTVGNMVDNLTGADDDHYPTAKAVADAISGGGMGDVLGPASSTDGDIVLFDGATGKIIKDSGVGLSSKLDASALSNNNYGGAWQGDSTHTPTKGVLYDKIHTMDVEIGNKAADTAVVKLTGNQTINGEKTFGTSPVVPSKTADATNTGTAIATEAQVYKKQDTISDLTTIRNGASAGATALQPSAISDTAYGSGWDADTTHAPSKNAVYDKIQSVVSSIPTVNNATLTVTQNGTSVGTFTANASSNVTIATTDTTYESKAASSGGTAVSLVTTGDKYNWNNQVNNTAYGSGWDGDTTHAPSKDAVYDKLKDLTDNKQDKLVNQTNIKSINGNSLLGSGDLEIAGGHDYSWKTKTGASFKIDLRSYIEPSQNFTVNLPDELEDGMEYVLRCVNGATAYTMTLGTGFTNPRNVSLSLNSYASDQFVFVAINGELELQPEPQLK